MKAFLKTSLALGFAASLMAVTASSSEAQSIRHHRTVWGPAATSNVVTAPMYAPMYSSSRTYYRPGYYRNSAAYGAYAYNPGAVVFYRGAPLGADGLSGCATDGNYNQIDYGAC